MDTEYIGNYDVIVVGGGPAGAVAAVASARCGAKTLLVEQNGYLGGMLTCAGTGPMMTFHAGRTQVVRGIAQEVVDRLLALGMSPGHMEDYNGYAASVTPFDAEGLKYVLDTMAGEAGVKLMYHTCFVSCETDAGRIRRVTLLAKDGLLTAEAAVFVDCSADADLAFRAGVPCLYGRPADHLAQPMTMNFRVGGVERDKVMDYVAENRADMLATIPFERLREIARTGIQGGYSRIRLAKSRGEFPVDRDQILCFETNTPGEFIVNMSRVPGRSAVRAFELTEAEIEGRRQAFAIWRFLKKYVPGFEDCRILSTGPNIGVRESRKIVGSCVLTAEDLVENRMFADAVAMGGYPIDIHSPDGAATNHRFLKEGSWYSVPYRSLFAREVENLLVAGRCISATHEACAAIRVTPIAMAVGQAAGTAAAMAAADGLPVSRVDCGKLRGRLLADGAFLTQYASGAAEGTFFQPVN